MTSIIVPIVEGQSEVESVPLLLRRLIHGQAASTIEIRRPIRVKRQRVVKAGELERAVELAAMQPNCRAILVLLDADDDCPALLGPDLLRRAQAARSDVPCRVVLAKAELESWLIGGIGAKSTYYGLRGVNQLPADTEAAPTDPKKWLRNHLESDCEPRVQECLAQRIDLSQARDRNGSLTGFLGRIEQLSVSG